MYTLTVFLVELHANSLVQVPKQYLALLERHTLVVDTDGPERG